MCNAFSCIVDRKKKVTWKFGTDSHEDLIRIAGLKDDTKDPNLITFCRCEISPKNMNYLDPDEWVFKITMDIMPAWWTLDHKKACEKAHSEWMDQLYKILVRKAIVHPFKIAPPERITEKHVVLLKEWKSAVESVRQSVGESAVESVRQSVRQPVRQSVWESVVESAVEPMWESVRQTVWKSVRHSVVESVRQPVRESIWESLRESIWESAREPVVESVIESVWAYTGSFFILPRGAWKYTENIKTDGYPFQPLVDLWKQGLVPSFNGRVWRLHGGEDAKILWEGRV